MSSSQAESTIHQPVEPKFYCISLGSIKVKLMCSRVISIIQCACESLAVELEKGRVAFEKILNISYRNHVTNEEIRRNSNWRIRRISDCGQEKIFHILLSALWLSREDSTGHDERKAKR